MAHTNGEECQEFGLYKSLCCGTEIVIMKGMDFPDCPNHPKLTTLWKEIRAPELLRRGNELKKKSPA